MQLGRKSVPYLNTNPNVVITSEESRIDTKFFLDHSQLLAMLSSVINPDTPWKLGDLPEGWEWFAFTFRDQAQISLSARELDEMLSASDEVTREAYSRMPITSGSHAWAKHQQVESEFIIQHCQLKTGQTVVDFGCGPGRHALELAAQGLNVTGVDYIRSFIQEATEKASEDLLVGAQFRVGDCRTIELGNSFDVAICLYDVIGSYADDLQNFAILTNIANHLKSGGYALLSVMNMELTERNATNWFSLATEADKLLELRPSGTMEQTGDVFDPQFYMIDKDTKIVYRKEQFQAGANLPEEFIIRDRRYTESQIKENCSKVGLEVIWSRLVRVGKWDESLPADSDRAKVILVLCKKAEPKEIQGFLF
jgi:2-polyprenyl-3-methyl-5-hydroxy-6-metoxy-1,4-benzoquinol methylase